MEFLANLCENLPHGVELLDHLLRKSMHINGNRELYFILVSILRNSAKPYFRFLQDWIFGGICDDSVAEFGLRRNDHLMNIRDRRFWTLAFAKVDFSSEFLADIQKQVFLCGKSLNLLKIIKPKHHLCQIFVPPKMKLLVSPTEEVEFKTQIADFSAKMQNMAENLTLSIKKVKEKEKSDRLETLEIASKRQQETLKRINYERKSKIEAEIERKSKILTEFKDRADDHRRKKAEERKKKAKEDLKFMEEAKKLESEQIAREEKVKKEMEDYYKRLTYEAEMRELRAEWRVKRAKLRPNRVKFWREDNKKSSQLLQNAKNEEKTTMVKMDLSIVAEEGQKIEDLAQNLSFIVKIQKDEMENVQIILENPFSKTIITENISNFSEFSNNEQNQILTEEFSTLSEGIRSKLMLNVKNIPESFDNGPVKKREGNSKRKRPDSFVESDQKRLEKSASVEDISRPARPRTRRQRSQDDEDNPFIYESLAAAISRLIINF